MRICPYCGDKPDDIFLHVFQEHRDKSERFEKFFSYSDSKGRKKNKIRKIALLQGGLKCVKCGKLLTRRDATKDHIVPKSLGGSGRIENIQLMCAECNREKSNSEAIDYR